MKNDLSDPVPAASCRVLVVDDMQDNRELLRFILQRKGITVLEASNGSEAIQVAYEQHPDGILMDLSMPLMNGFEATRQLKSCETTKHIPVVALSAHCGESEQCARALEAGCLYCLNKPLELAMLDTFLKIL